MICFPVSLWLHVFFSYARSKYTHAYVSTVLLLVGLRFCAFGIQSPSELTRDEYLCRYFPDTSLTGGAGSGGRSRQIASIAIVFLKKVKVYKLPVFFRTVQNMVGKITLGMRVGLRLNFDTG